MDFRYYEEFARQNTSNSIIFRIITDRLAPKSASKASEKSKRTKIQCNQMDWQIMMRIFR